MQEIQPPRRCTKCKWIEFANRLIKKKDCDYFEMILSENTITLNYHQGMNYMIANERMISGKDMIKRFKELKQLLGID